MSAVPWLSGEKEVAVVVLRPGGGHVTTGGQLEAVVSPRPAAGYDQCVLTQCQAAGAQAMYSPITQEFANRLQDWINWDGIFGFCNYSK